MATTNGCKLARGYTCGGKSLERHSLCEPWKRALNNPLLLNPFKGATDTLQGDQQHANNGTHFYASRILSSFASQHVTPVTLRQVVVFGRQLSPEKLIQSANYIRTELPIRLAHRLVSMQRELPYAAIAGSPHLASVYDMYWHAFNALRALPEVHSLADNHAFCQILQARLAEHRTVLPKLALGMHDCLNAGVLGADAVDSFMSEMVKSRIGRRVLAQQHLALTAALAVRNSDPDAFASFRSSIGPPELALQASDRNMSHSHSQELNQSRDHWIGIVHTSASAAICIRKAYAVASKLLQNTYPKLEAPPPLVLDGHVDSTFTCIPDHIEYILLEVLKNSLLATAHACAKDLSSGASADFDTQKIATRPVRATVSASQGDLIIRISDQGNGFSKDGSPFSNLRRNLFSFASARAMSSDAQAALAATPYLSATVAEQRIDYQASASLKNTGDGLQLPTMPLRHLGIGCALARCYTNYWGGSIQTVPLDGYGTDMYLRVNRRGTVHEHVMTRGAMAVDAT